MIRYEVTSNGSIVEEELFNAFNELDEMTVILKNSGLNPKLQFVGRGGYYVFDITIDEERKRLHIYLKKVTFGGREARPYEKRAQFSAALDRNGYVAGNNNTDLTIIIGLYKVSINSEAILCAWEIENWGTNIGRAFNCFTDVRTIATAYTEGFSQYKTTIGQISCSFKPHLMKLYLKNRKILHDRLLDNADLTELSESSVLTHQPEYKMPRYEDLFQLILDVLRQYDGIASNSTIEIEVGDKLGLSDFELQKVHNTDEGSRTELGYRLAWARFYLQKAKFITTPKRGIWSLTNSGFATSKVDISELKKIKESIDAFEVVKLEDRKEVEESEGVELEKESVNEYIEFPFDPSLVDIRTRSMSLDLILKRLNKQGINMNTSFQRKAGLWTVTKQSRLIESILVKIPLPVFYFDGSDDDCWLVVDGLQRLTSLHNFVNKQSFKLTNLEFLIQFNGKGFNELPAHLQRRIEEFEITAYIIAPGTPKTLKFNVFKRINTGGLTLTSQEIRNALNPGIPAEFVKNLAGCRSFKIATDYSINEDRMLDREFITRFLTFYLFPFSEYNSDLELLLNESLEKIAHLDNQTLEAIAKDFCQAMDTAFQIFGKDAFRKRYNAKQGRKPLNKALFEVWSVLLSQLNAEESSLLIAKKETILNNFSELLNTDDVFNNAISSSTNHKTSVNKRFKIIDQLIKTTLILK